MKYGDVHIIGGGTISHVRSHLALAAPAYGTTAKRLKELWDDHGMRMSAKLHLSKMADPSNPDAFETWEQLQVLTMELIDDKATNIIFFNPAVVDFRGWIAPGATLGRFNNYVDPENSSKYASRLHSKNQYMMELDPLPKLISTVRRERKDIFLVGFKTTTDAITQDQYIAGLKLLKQSSCNLVLANDVKTRMNMVIVPEEASYHVTTDREQALRGLIDMTSQRANSTFTRSIVVDGASIPWDAKNVPASLRKVVDYCIDQGAYKPFLGSTAGHFAFKASPNIIYTSKRKTNFNDLENVGMVAIQIKGDDKVIAWGAKPSVGGQSQRIVFEQHPQYDCIVHFHCPRKYNSLVPVASQREFECGSHQCGRNTSEHLHEFKLLGNLAAVYLDNHGPNIVFHHSIDPDKVINFIDSNFELSQKTGGPVELSAS